MTRLGKEFEELVADTFSRFCSPLVVLKANDKIWGFDSERQREVDLSIRDSAGLFIVEAKDHGRPVGLNGIGCIFELREDVRASRSAMVAAAGFTQPAKNRAERADLRLFTLIDPVGAHRGLKLFTADAICAVTCVQELRLNFECADEFFERNWNKNPLCLELFDHSYKALGALHDVVLEIDLPIADHDQVLLKHPILSRTVLVQDRDSQGGYRELMLTATVRFRTESWRGKLELLQGRGLYDERENAATLSGKDAIFELPDPGRFRTSWQRIHCGDPCDGRELFFRYIGINSMLVQSGHECRQ